MLADFIKMQSKDVEEEEVGVNWGNTGTEHLAPHKLATAISLSGSLLG